MYIDRVYREGSSKGDDNQMYSEFLLQSPSFNYSRYGSRVHRGFLVLSSIPGQGFQRFWEIIEIFLLKDFGRWVLSSHLLTSCNLATARSSHTDLLHRPEIFCNKSQVHHKCWKQSHVVNGLCSESSHLDLPTVPQIQIFCIKFWPLASYFIQLIQSASRFGPKQLIDSAQRIHLSRYNVGSIWNHNQIPHISSYFSLSISVFPWFLWAIRGKIISGAAISWTSRIIQLT